MRYVLCFCIAAAIVFIVLALSGFDFDGVKNSMRLLHDAFFLAGALMSAFAGLLFASGEGAFLGIGYALKSVVRVFIPVWRKEHETYAQYRERKLAKPKPTGESCILFTGLFFLAVSIIFLVIWYQV